MEEKVQRIMQHVLDRLKAGDGELTLTTAEGEYVVTEEALLNDLLIFSEDVFDGEAALRDGAVRVAFRNGQTFRISVAEEF